MRPSTRTGYETPSDEDLSDAAAKQQVGEELFAVVAMLDGNAQLRRMLSDPVVDPGRRERLAADLLAERIVGESLTDDKTQSRVVDRFLEDLDASEAKGVR